MCTQVLLNGKVDPGGVPQPFFFSQNVRVIGETDVPTVDGGVLFEIGEKGRGPLCEEKKRQCPLKERIIFSSLPRGETWLKSPWEEKASRIVRWGVACQTGGAFCKTCGSPRIDGKKGEGGERCVMITGNRWHQWIREHQGAP